MEKSKKRYGAEISRSRKISNHPYAKLIIENCQSASLKPINVNLTDGEDGVYGTYKGEEVSMTKAISSELLKLQDALQTAMEQGHGASVLTKGRNQWLSSHLFMMM